MLVKLCVCSRPPVFGCEASVCAVFRPAARGGGTAVDGFHWSDGDNKNSWYQICSAEGRQSRGGDGVCFCVSRPEIKSLQELLQCSSAVFPCSACPVQCFCQHAGAGYILTEMLFVVVLFVELFVVRLRTSVRRFCDVEEWHPRECQD